MTGLGGIKQAMGSPSRKPRPRAPMAGYPSSTPLPPGAWLYSPMEYRNRSMGSTPSWVDGGEIPLHPELQEGPLTTQVPGKVFSEPYAGPTPREGMWPGQPADLPTWLRFWLPGLAEMMGQGRRTLEPPSAQEL